MKRIRAYLCICGLLLFTLSDGQAYNLDSLRRVTQGVSSDSLRFFAYLELTVAYNRINYDSALKYALKAQQLSAHVRDSRWLARSKYRIATVYINQGQIHQARALLDTALRLFSVQRDTANLLAAKIDLGKLLKNTFDYDSAVKVFFEAMELSEKVGDKNAAARVKNYVALIYQNQKQYNLAIRYYKDALKLVSELNFKPGISAILTNLGDLYRITYKYDSAIIFHRQALHVKKEIKDQLGTARVYRRLGNTFSSLPLSRVDSALFYYKKSLSLAKKLNDRELIAMIHSDQLHCTLLEGDLQKAYQIKKELSQELDDLPNLTLKIESYDRFALLHAAMNQPEKAFEYQAKRDVYQNKLLSKERLRVTQETEAKYQNEANKKSIRLLKTDNKLKELQIAKKQNERNGLIVLSILSLATIGLLINRFLVKQRTNSKLKELDRIKSDFFANISHEFRTPLSLIMAPLKKKMELEKDASQLVPYALMYRNADYLLQLTNQLLDLSRLDQGTVALHPQPTSITGFLKVIAASFRSLAEHKLIQFHVEFPQEETLLIDTSVLEKICNNLLSNAFKFTPQKGSVSFIVNFIKRNSLQIEVKDTGQGILIEKQEKIFDRFYQVSEHDQGTGIGLALTKELVFLLNGTINLESEEGEGTSFKVVIPVERTDVKPVSVPFSGANNSYPTLKKANENIETFKDQTILIIEDNVDLANYLELTLGETYHVVKTKDGKEGISAALDEVPDLIISDVMMPQVNGLEVCEMLKQNEATSHIPIVLLTAKADQETKLKGLSYEADDYLLKPFDPEELKMRVSNLLNQRSKLKEKYQKLIVFHTDDLDLASPEELFLKRAVEIVQANLNNPAFSVEEFCQEIGMSRMQLHRKLTALTNHSTSSFIRRQRLIKASQLLQKGYSISEVAYAVGFSSLSYFTKVFKKEYGKVPSAYMSPKT